MTSATLVRPSPRSFTPPGDRSRRLAHLDPRPLYPDAVEAASPWRSPSFYLACAIVMPLAAIVAPIRGLRSLF